MSRPDFGLKPPIDGMMTDKGLRTQPVGRLTSVENQTGPIQYGREQPHTMQSENRAD